jgi:gluconolactonase
MGAQPFLESWMPPTPVTAISTARSPAPPKRTANGPRGGARQWRLVASYDGWPNGMKVAPDGRLIVADYRRGLLSVDPESGTVETILGTISSEGFKGLNDLQLLPDGSIRFTDQGQTGMQDPSGRLYRFWPDGRLDRIIANAPSSNGVAVSREGTHAFLALTRAAQVWRMPLAPSAQGGRTQVCAQLPGGLSGPDGLVVDGHGRLIVCDPGHGCAWVLSPLGVPLYPPSPAPAGR